MRTLKRLGMFAIIALVTQLAVLVYINNFMLGSLSTFNSEDVKPEEELKILVPENINELYSSYNGQYCSYYNEDTLYIIDTNTGMRKKMDFRDGQTLNLYKWYNNSNRMILVEQTTSVESGTLKIASYDAEVGQKEDLKDLSWIGNNIRVEAIDFAGENDFVIKIAQSDSKSDIYYVGEEVSKLTTVTRNIGFISYAGNEKKVLYQDKATKKYYFTGSKKALELKNSSSQVLDFDSLGNVYIFDKKEENKKYIHFKNLDDGQMEWNSIELEQDVDIEDININKDGTLFIDNPLQGKFTEAKSKVSINYDGKFMSAYKGGIFTVKDGLLEQVEFNESKNK